MENAADALRIAFGAILALLLISLLIGVFYSISRVENNKEEQAAIQEAVEFNKKFLAFDKTLMYGTDLISILGLAIANNETVNQAYEMKPDGMYHEDRADSINIIFQLQQPIEQKTITYIKKYENEKNQSADGREYETGRKIITWSEDASNTQTTKLFKTKPTSYSLLWSDYKSADNIKKSDYITYTAIYKIAVEGNSNVTYKTTSTKRVETDSSGFNDFKKRIFKCTNVGYSDIGKINSMTFEETLNER